MEGAWKTKWGWGEGHSFFGLDAGQSRAGETWTAIIVTEGKDSFLP